MEAANRKRSSAAKKAIYCEKTRRKPSFLYGIYPTEGSGRGLEHGLFTPCSNRCSNIFFEFIRFGSKLSSSLLAGESPKGTTDFAPFFRNNNHCKYSFFTSVISNGRDGRIFVPNCSENIVAARCEFMAGGDYIFIIEHGYTESPLK